MSSVFGDRPASVACWLSGAILLAVAAAVDPWGFRPFTTWRWAVVGVVAAGAVAVTTRWRMPRWTIVAGVALLVALGLATALALDPLQALVGHGRRHMGLAGWLVCALAFLVGNGLDAGDVRRHLGRAAVLAAAITGGAAIGDLLGWDPFGTRFADERIGGLLGQPTYLGALAVLLAPVAAGVALDRTAGTGWRRLAGLAAATCTVAVLGSQTRGAWLGGAVALALGWRAAVRLANRHRPVAVTALVVLALVVVVGPLGERGGSTLDPSRAGGVGRLDEWRLATSVVADDPLTGVGPEGYRIAAPSHIDADYARAHGRDEVVDRAHNGLLDVAATGGLPAALAYLVLLGGVVACCVRTVRRPPDPVVAGAATGVVGWTVQQLVSFPIAEVDPAAWLLAGVVVASASGAADGESSPTSNRGTVIAHRFLVGGLACLFAVAGGLAVAADHSLRRAERQRAADPAGAIVAADRATVLRPDDIDAWYVAARVASSPAGLLAVDAGLDRVEQGLEWSPDDPALLDLEEELLVERALRSGLEEDITAAGAAVDARTAADPAGPLHYRRRGLLLATQGEDARAGAAFRRALDLDPDDTVARDGLAALDLATAEES